MIPRTRISVWYECDIKCNENEYDVFLLVTQAYSDKVKMKTKMKMIETKMIFFKIL